MKRRMNYRIPKWMTRIFILAAIVSFVIAPVRVVRSAGESEQLLRISQSRPQPPPAPAITPGPDIIVAPGKSIALRARSAGTTSYKWGLQGEGKISSTTGPAVLYTAPAEESGTAIVSAIAYNGAEASPPSTVIITIGAPSIKLDALAVPAGWMTGSKNQSPDAFLGLESSEIKCHDGKDCGGVTKVVYKPGGVWGAMYWWPPSCGDSGSTDAWAKVKNASCGVNILQAGDINTVNRLTFWARGERGGEKVEFKIGAIDIPPSPGRSLGKVKLTTTWKSYEISLGKMDLTNAIVLFVWSASDMDNARGAVFYLDDVQFEGTR